MIGEPISIHAPHARSDIRAKQMYAKAQISIHAPHARSDCCSRRISTLLLNFNPRSSCEERPDFWAPPQARTYFNPRSSCEERRGSLPDMPELKTISIHAPHARSDRHSGRTSRPSWYFNPRSSCEERRGRGCESFCYRAFQSTLLMRGATGNTSSSDGVGNISIHAPHARSDSIPAFSFQSAIFQSTLLMRGATRRSIFLV